METSSKKPCLVQAKQGFSIYYKERFLYSKYDPRRNIEQKVESLKILPGTLILCCSPVLEYGLLELQKKLPEDCLMILCEFDMELNDFEKVNLNKVNNPDITRVLSVNDLYHLPVNITQKGFLISPEKIKRVIRVDFSAGTVFHEDLYQKLHEACTKSIMTYWSNRITLTKFGRLYSHNFFKNLKNLPKTKPVNEYYKSITKPILVFGAGESINEGLKEIISCCQNFYIICVDASLQSLLEHNIIPDAVFIEEAQTVIGKAFLGTTEFNFHIFAGLSSLSSLSHLFNISRISYFNTRFSDSEFLDEPFLPPPVPPLGSVGLTAVYHALLFRQSTEIPVYIYGLDFSYSAGFTHGKGTQAHLQRLLFKNRIRSLNNYDAAFSDTSISFVNEKGRKLFTTQNLRSYGISFAGFFGNEKNLFNAGEPFFPLNIPFKKPDFSDASTFNNEDNSKDISYKNRDSEKIINEYLKNEKESLLYLKNLLTKKSGLSDLELEAEIKKTASPREYLYLHFPDGCSFKYNQSFLNRIRTEIDFMLKIL